MMIQRVNANSPAQAVKSRARGPTITQLRAKQAALVAASELAASSRTVYSVLFLLGRIRTGAAAGSSSESNATDVSAYVKPIVTS